MPSAPLRLSGYQAAVQAAGLDPDVVAVPGVDFIEEAGSSAARTLLGRASMPTAIVTSNDQEAVGLMQVLTRAGLSVPDQVSVTGYDDSRFAQLSSVDLTTARQDPEEMGRDAVAVAVRRIQRPGSRPTLRVIQPRLVVRGSTGPPRSD
jgi:DNA-binding LacI/PurR family transcriptional regulator